MRKIILLTALLFLTLSLGVGTLAQGAELPSPGLTPDSPFYFLERISERIGTFFTFGDLKKAERYTALAAERIAEAQAVIKKEKPETARIALERYEDQLGKALARAEKAKAKGKNIEKVTETIAKATGEHLIVLERVLEEVPEEIEEAKVAIVKAKEISVIGQKNALRALARENPEQATEINLKAAEARLDRARTKAEEGETDEVAEAIKEFESQHKFGEEISQIAKEIGKDTTLVEQLVGKATSVHLEVLAEVYEKVPEEAKPAIEQAMTVSTRGHERVVKVLKEKNALEEVPEITPMPEEIPEEVKERIQKKVEEELEEEKLEEEKVGGKISCKNNLDCPSQMKCENFVCVDVGCLKEGGIIPIVAVSPEGFEIRKHMVTECCEGLKAIASPDDFDENCNFILKVGVIGGGVCSKCGNGVCERWETKCNCPEDCKITVEEEEKEIICIGKGGETWAVDPNCCEGLKVVSDCLPDEPCPISLRYCVDCGNGVCDVHENWYNCLEDCFKTAGDCEKITDSVERNACYSNVARETKDASLCEKITESSKKDTCYYIIATGVTRGTKDTSLCGKITGSSKKDGCYYVIAVETKDAGPCEKIADGTKKDNCYYFVAIGAKDASPCEKITNDGKRNSCYTDVGE